MFKDEELKSIGIVDAETNEIIALIDKEGNVVNNKETLVIMDYSKDDEKIIEEKNGKFYRIGE